MTSATNKKIKEAKDKKTVNGEEISALLKVSERIGNKDKSNQLIPGSCYDRC